MNLLLNLQSRQPLPGGDAVDTGGVWGATSLVAAPLTTGRLAKNWLGGARWRASVGALCLVGIVVCITVAAPGAAAASLRDLGFPHGLVLRVQSPQDSVYVPVPPDASGGRLTLDFAASAATGPQTMLTVEVDGTPVATEPVSAAGSPVSIRLPEAVGSEIGRWDFVKLTFISDFEAGTPAHCARADMAAHWIRIAPMTALAPIGGRTGVGAAWRNLSAPVTIALPGTPTLADIGSALILSTALVERGITPFITQTNKARTASIRIASGKQNDGSAKGGGQSASLTTAPNGRSQIVVSSQAAARALVLAARLVAARDKTTIAADHVSAHSSSKRAGSISLGALGIASDTVAVGRSAAIPLPLGKAGLPFNRHVVAVVLNGRGAALAPGAAEAATLMVGNHVVWSRAFRGAPVLDHVKVDLPTRLLEAGAQLRLKLTRLGTTRVCRRHAARPFTLENSSRFILASGPKAPTKFAGFSPAAGAMPVLTDLSPVKLGPTLPLVAQLLANKGVSPTSIEMRKADATPTHPFLLIARSPGSIVATAPLPQPRADEHGAVSLKLPNQSSSLTIPGAASDSILQLVSTSSGTAGLWLSPGPKSSLTQAVLPGDGNIAFYTGVGTPATFDTVLHRADEASSASASVAGWFAAWRTEIFVVIWLVIALILVVVVTRRRSGK